MFFLHCLGIIHKLKNDMNALFIIAEDRRKKGLIVWIFFDIQVGENCSTDLVLISNAGNKTDYTEDICVDLRWLNQLFV